MFEEHSRCVCTLKSGKLKLTCLILAKRHNTEGETLVQLTNIGGLHTNIGGSINAPGIVKSAAKLPIKL